MECHDEEGRIVKIKGAQQLGRFFRKGCQVYVVHTTKVAKGTSPRLEDHPLLQVYANIFPEEVLGLPLKRDIDFSIRLVPRVVPISKAPYRMSTPELLELKLQLQELMDKKYI